MKFLGIDYGSKRIGLAVSDPMAMIAFPRDTIQNDGKALESIADIITAEHIDTVVIGDTRSHGGRDNPITEEAESFAISLIQKGFKVEKIWEMWSSVGASRYAPEGKEHDDAAAAAIILQRYLDTRVQE